MPAQVAGAVCAPSVGTFSGPGLEAGVVDNCAVRRIDADTNSAWRDRVLAIIPARCITAACKRSTAPHTAGFCSASNALMCAICGRLGLGCREKIEVLLCTIHARAPVCGSVKGGGTTATNAGLVDM